MNFYFKCILLALLFSFNSNIQAFDTDQDAWENRIEDYFQKNTIPYLAQLRFYTYLYAAQNDAFNCPKEVQNALTAHLIKRFYPHFPLPGSATNPRAERCADEILDKYYRRLKQEELNSHTFPSSYWFHEIPSSVSIVAKWIPWVSPLPKPPPPLARDNQQGWAEQIGKLQQIRRNLTPQQREIIKKWVGHHGPGANWRVIFNKYMEEHQTPQIKVRLVRSVLMKALYDGIIAEMDAKYTYGIPRPYMMYPEFQPLIKKLKTPSYPSGHGVQGAVFAGIASYYFPEDSHYWHHLDEQGAHTRLWAGVHFPEDIEQGRLLGAKVADQMLSSMAASENETYSDALQAH